MPAGPNRGHVEQILKWTAGLPAEALLLIHCLAGESRSPAVALGILARDLTADEASRALMGIRPQAKPNRLVVSLFDNALGKRGELVRTLVPS